MAILQRTDYGGVNTLHGELPFVGWMPTASTMAAWI
jgi:hypothetical protein